MMYSRVIGLCVVGLLATGTVLADDATESPDGRLGALTTDIVNQVLGLTDSTLATLDVPDTPGEPFLVSVPLDGADYLLDLSPHSVRAHDFQLFVQQADGSLVLTTPDVIRTLRGSVDGFEGSSVAASLLETGFVARIDFPDLDGTFWVEPLSPHFPEAAEDEYVIFRTEDSIKRAGSCGTDEVLNFAHVDEAHGNAGARGGDCGEELYIADLGIDADFEYFQDHGSTVSSTEAAMESIINTVNVQYETETQITHVISVSIVRSSEPDPYGSSSYITLLNNFRNDWLSNVPSGDYDLAHLFTGKNLTGSVIGVAWGIGEVCTSGAFCLSESDFSNDFNCKTDLTAHELGHLWGAFHCSCTNNTMNSFITCANDFHNTFTVPDIESHRNSRGCLECGVSADPLCDDIDGFHRSCNSNSALKMGLHFSNTLHDGETVIFEVNGSPIIVTVVNDSARIFLPGQDPGTYAIGLQLPADCIPWGDPVDVTCD